MFENAARTNPAPVRVFRTIIYSWIYLFFFFFSFNIFSAKFYVHTACYQCGRFGRMSGERTQAHKHMVARNKFKVRVSDEFPRIKTVPFENKHFTFVRSLVCSFGSFVWRKTDKVLCTDGALNEHC